jgi:hypothetical protein
MRPDNPEDLLRAAMLAEQVRWRQRPPVDGEPPAPLSTDDQAASPPVGPTDVDDDAP